MPPEQNAPEAAAAAPVAAAPAATPTLATSVVEAAPSAEGLEGKAPAEGATPAPDAVAAKDKPTEDEPKVEGAPETYEAFAAPEGVELPTAVLDAFQGTARKFNLSQAQAQELLNDMAPVVAKQNSEAINALQKKAVSQWLKETQNDKEFGGENLQANLAIAHRAMTKDVATPALRKLLDDSGLGNHPEVIRWMYRVGKHMTPDNKHLTGAAQTGGEKTVTETLWPPKT